ncbi:MAG: Wzz/FepE/Etk N-terminal domain-containing protein [Pseudohongiellaceae bacterium]
MNEPYYAERPPVADDEIDLLELWQIIWDAKWLVIAITGVAAVLSVVYALVATEIYRAEATLSPAQQRQAGSSLANQLGGAASLVGINLGSGEGGDRVTTAIAILESRRFTVDFIHRHELEVPLMAGRCCGPEQTNEIDPEVYDVDSGTWLREDGPPSDWQLFQRFSDLRSINRDNETGLIRMAIEWHDPRQAQQWVNWLVEDINAYMKEQDVQEAEGAIDYLRGQLESTGLVDMQQVFYDLIESQTRTIMLADVRDEYVFRVVDPAIAPEQRVRPRRSLIAVVGTMAGGMLALLVVFIRRMVRNARERQKTV